MRTHGPELAYVAPGLPLKFSRGRGGAVETGAMALLAGESAGMALDFTGNGGLGYAAVKGHTTNLTNVPVDQFLTQSGTSPKLVMGADGLYHWSPHNLLTYSEQLDNAVWTKFTGATVSANAGTAPDGSVTADKVVPVTGSRVGVYQIIGITGVVATWSIRLKAAGFVWVALETSNFDLTWFNVATGVIGTINSNHTAAISDLGGGWYLCSITTKNFWNGAAMLIVTDADNTQSVTASGANGVLAWGAQVNRGPTALAYHATTAAAWFGVPIEYGGGGYYALVEPQSTNLLLQSQAFNTTWAVAAIAVALPVVTPDVVTAPDGTLTADRIVLPAAATGASVVLQQAVPSAAPHTFSVWLRGAVGGEQVFISSHDNATAYIESARITLTTQWVRYSITGTPNVAAVYWQIGYDARGPVQAASSINGGTIYAWGAQLELGSVPTSPIPTFAATVTRAVDAVMATSGFPLGSACSIYADFQSQLINGGFQQGVVDLDDVTFNELIALRFDFGGILTLTVNDGGAGQAGLALGGASVSATRVQGSAVAAANGFLGSLNGGAVQTDASGTMPTVTRLKFGSLVDNGTNVLLGGLRLNRLVLVPRAVAAADLPTWRYAP